MSKNERIGLFVWTIALIGVLAGTLKLNLIDTAQAIQITMSFILVSITFIYVKRTSDIAEETKKQRYSESLPLLIPSIIPAWNTEGLAHNEVPIEYSQSGIGIKVMWRNVGKGVAINTRFSFWAAPTSPGKSSFFPPCELGALEVEGEKEIDFSNMLNDKQLKEISDTYSPRLEAEYQDIYEREITTVQEFIIDKENERAFLGELYFTINGRRLGQEVTQHD